MGEMNWGGGNKLSNIVKEQQEYERKRDNPVKPTCGLSWVQATNAIVLNGGAHLGVVSHVCGLSPEHEGVCKCGLCGVTSLNKK